MILHIVWCYPPHVPNLLNIYIEKVSFPTQNLR